MNSRAYLIDIKRKVTRYRIENSLTQKDLSQMTGLSLRSIQRFESGNDISLENFFKILIALGLADSLNDSIPDLEKRPSAFLDREKNNTKKRAHKSKTSSQVEFKWGDEE